MLYDGAIRFLKQGIQGVEASRLDEAFEGFSRTQKIVLELLNSLNYDVDRVLCTRMASIYNFIYRKLVDASLNRDVKQAREALGLLEYQRETWVLLMDKLRQERGGAVVSRSPQPLDYAPANECSSLSVQG